MKAPKEVIVISLEMTSSLGNLLSNLKDAEERTGVQKYLLGK